MKDLTQGPIRGHLMAMAIPMAVGMGVQMLYYLVDLYFVAGLGDAALAGVSAAGTTSLLILGLSQILSVGTVALVARAIGAGERKEANELFHQALLLGGVCALLTLLAGYLFVEKFMAMIASDAQVAALGTTYLHWYLPGLALQFLLTAIGSGMRGAGMAQPAMMVQLLTVVINMVLAPVLIAGWGTGHALGVAGAGLASSISVGAGVLLLARYCGKPDAYLRLQPGMLRLRAQACRRILAIGLPAGGEYLLMFLFSAYVYFLLRGFGEAAQAGFGIGARVMQVIFLPAAALGFAVPAVAGQNIGAGLRARVRETLRVALTIEVALMLVLTLLCQWSPGSLLAWSDAGPEVQAVAITFLVYSSWNFIASGIIFTCSGMFQALGNTWPALGCAAMRVFTFAAPLAYLAQQPGFELTHIWQLSIASVMVQAALGLFLVFRQLDLLPPAGTAPATVLTQ